MLIANHAKKGYYVRRVKDSLWGIFGINRIKPFGDNYSKDQMKAWKQQKNVKKVHEEIYTPSDPDNPASDTFLTLIIKSVFPAEEERTQANAIWTQAVLEVIFNEEHTSLKIEADIVETWTHKISATQVNTYALALHYLLLWK